MLMSGEEQKNERAWFSAGSRSRRSPEMPAAIFTLSVAGARAQNALIGSLIVAQSGHVLAVLIDFY